MTIIEEPRTLDSADTAIVTPSRRSLLRPVLGWAAVAAALAASAGLVLFALDNDSHAPRAHTPSETAALYGSINAIEHREAAAQTGGVHTPSETVATYGSINAIEHREAAAAGARTPSETVAEQGSINAIEHRDDGSDS